MNACNRMHQIAVSRTSMARRSGWHRGQFRQNASHQLCLQRGKLAFENLRHRSLNDLLKFLAVRHAQRTNSIIKSFRDAARTKGQCPKR